MPTKALTQGFKGQVFHVHVRYGGDWDELYFRDYLLEHPEIVDEYGKLKLKLKKKYEHDRDGYTYAKTDFIKRITELAKAKMLNSLNEAIAAMPGISDQLTDQIS